MEISSLHRHVRAQDVPLERLSANGSIPEKEKVAEVSRHFEAVLLRQVLSSAQKPHFKSKYAQDSSGGAIYRDLVTNQLADGISRSAALGLGKVLALQMSHEAKPDQSATVAPASPSGPGAANAKLRPTPSKGAYRPHSIGKS